MNEPAGCIDWERLPFYPGCAVRVGSSTECGNGAIEPIRHEPFVTARLKTSRRDKVGSATETCH
jgi:hypothetical protein